jgi:hypothetical protein
MYASGQYTMAAIATTLGVSRASIYRHLGVAAATLSRTHVRRAMAARCSFCGATDGPFVKVEGLFTVLMCADPWPSGLVVTSTPGVCPYSGCPGYGTPTDAAA